MRPRRTCARRSWVNKSVRGFSVRERITFPLTSPKEGRARSLSPLYFSSNPMKKTPDDFTRRRDSQDFLWRIHTIFDLSFFFLFRRTNQTRIQILSYTNTRKNPKKRYTKVKYKNMSAMKNFRHSVYLSSFLVLATRTIIICMYTRVYYLKHKWWFTFNDTTSRRIRFLPIF